MTDRGLNSRLRQRSRRSGLMIGISMALTIAVCVGGFSVIYAALDPFTSDFVTETDPTATSRPGTEVSAQQPEPTQAPTGPVDETGTDPEPTQEPDTEPTATASSGDNQIEQSETPDDEDFTPDYQISAGQNVRLRSGPGTNTDTVTSLTSEQALQYLGQSEESDDPDRDGLASDQVWMQFRTEDGEEGWVREIDVEPYQE